MAGSNGNYNVPFGIDPKDFFKELTNIDNGLDRLEGKAVNSQKEMQAAFNTTSAAGDKLAQTISNTQAKAGNLADQAKKMGKELGDALSGKGIGEGLNGKIDAVRKKLQAAAQTAIYVDVDFNDKKVDLLSQQIRAASTAAEEFNVILDFSKQQLAGMEPGGQIYGQLAKQIETAEQFINQLNEAAGSTIPTARALTNEFDKLFSNPGDFLAGKELQKLDAVVDGSANEVQRLNGIVGLLNENLATLNPNTQAFTELQQVVQAGAAALQQFEQTTESIAPAEGEVEAKTVSLRTQMRTMREELSRLELAGKGDTAEFKNLARAAGELQDQIGDTQQRIRAFASDTKYLDAGISAVTGLAGAFTAAQGAVALFGDENEKTQKVIAKVTGAMAILQGIQAVANTLNKDSAFSVIFLSKARAADAAAATAEATATAEVAAAEGAATVATTGFTAALLLNPIVLITAAIVAAVAALVLYASASGDAADAAERFSNIVGLSKNSLDDQIKNLERGAALQTAYAKLRGASDTELNQITEKSLKQQMKAREDFNNDIDKNLNELKQRFDTGKIDEEDYNKAVENIYKERSANSQAIYDADNKIQINSLTTQADANKKAAEQRKKDLEDIKKQAEEAKKVNDQVVKFAKELYSSSVAAMKEGADKEKAQAKLAAKERIDALNNEQALSVKAQDLRKKAIVAINKQLGEELAKIDKDAADKRVELQLNANAQLAGMEAEGYLKDRDVLKAEYESKKHEIEKQYKDEAGLRVSLLASLYAQYNTNVKKTTQEAGQKARDNQEESEILTIELLTKNAERNKDVEEQKQIEILKVQLKYAQKSLDAIVDDGTDETALRKKRAQKLVSDISGELAGATEKNDTKGLDWFKVFGLGDLTDGQKTAVGEAAQKSLESIKTITDYIVDQYQRQIDKKQEVIDQYNNQIDDLESALDREQDLRSKGLANNVAAIEQELVEKKKQRDEELKQQEELQKKQAAAQKAQIALDSVTQATNLITASTSIFKALAGIPFIGVPLAITTIALMTGAFVAAKAKAFAAVGDGTGGAQKYKMGGWIKGRSHEGGGQKYGSLDGSGGVKELEDGEHVTNKTQATKYADLLEAINTGSIEGMSEDVLRELLAPMGISLSADVARRAVAEVGQLDSARSLSIAGGKDAGDVKAIREDVSFLATQKRGATERWEDDKYYYEKTGITLQKIKK